jgi:hypothetical protein
MCGTEHRSIAWRAIMERMLYHLIKENRELLLSRCAKLSAENGCNSDLQTASLGGVSVFFDQLIDALHLEHGVDFHPNLTLFFHPNLTPLMTV